MSTFITSISGKSVEAPAQLIQHHIESKRTVVVPVNYQPVPRSQYSLFAQGIPSQAHYIGDTQPPAFAQGTDVVFNAWIWFNGQQITDENWVITVTLKPNEHTRCYLWQGILNAGIYKINGETPDKSFYQIWIPRTDTEKLLEGTYWFDIALEEKVGQHEGVKPLKAVVGQWPFELYYGISSPNPEGIGDTVMAPIRGSSGSTPLPVDTTR